MVNEWLYQGNKEQLQHLGTFPVLVKSNFQQENGEKGDVQGKYIDECKQEKKKRPIDGSDNS